MKSKSYGIDEIKSAFYPPQAISSAKQIYRKRLVANFLGVTFCEEEKQASERIFDFEKGKCS